MNMHTMTSIHVTGRGQTTRFTARGTFMRSVPEFDKLLNVKGIHWENIWGFFSFDDVIDYIRPFPLSPFCKKEIKFQQKITA